MGYVPLFYANKKGVLLSLIQQKILLLSPVKQV